MNGLLHGMAIGLSAGIVPGPLIALYLAHTVRHGWRRTLPAVLAPLVSDLPIVVLVVFILSRIPAWMIPALRTAGGVYLIFVSVRIIRRSPNLDTGTPGQAGLTGLFRSAVAINLLNPNPYIFWGITLGPILVSEWRSDPVSAAAFVFGFYAVMISVFAGWVLLFGRTTGLTPVSQRTVTVAAGWLMAGFGLFQIVIGLGQSRLLL